MGELTGSSVWISSKQMGMGGGIVFQELQTWRLLGKIKGQ